MRQVLYNSDKDLLLNVPLNDEQEVRRQWGVPSGTVVFEYGYVSFTTDGKIELSQPIYGIKSIRLIVDIDTTTEDVIQLSSTHSVSTVAGTVTATGFSSPTIYVDGVATSTVVAGKAEITITTATPFVADNIILGYISSYLEGKIYEVQLYNIVLDSSATINLYSNSRYMMPQLDTADHQRILHATARNGVVQNLVDYHNGAATPEPVLTDIEVVKDGEIRSPLFNLSSSKVDVGNYFDGTGDLTIIQWLKLYDYGHVSPRQGRLFDNGKLLGFIDGTSKRLSIFNDNINVASPVELWELQTWYCFIGVRTAAGVWDIYRDGELIKADDSAGTPVAGTNNFIVGGKETVTRPLKGLLPETIVLSGLLTPEEISQYFTATKPKYEK